MSWKILFTCIAVSLPASCSSVYKTQVVPNPNAPRILSAEDQKSPRQIEIYFDGTSNDWAARTNVRRRFEAAALAEDPAQPCLYIEGVGTKGVSGKAFGLGMKSRVLDAYKFLARHYRVRTASRPDDRILVFGFSRGAFQARMLTGLMAHCGLPCTGNARVDERALDALAGEVWTYCEEHLVDLTKEESEQGGPARWRARLADNRSRLQAALSPRHPGYSWANPAVKLLAIWDTVPGLSFTALSQMEQPVNGRQRYKVGAYPNVETIVHALSLDDRRSKFEPLVVGPPIDPPATNVYEVWFPGAHSDVGGGYSDSNDMAGTSFNWLHRILRQRGITTRDTKVYEDSTALMHHPEGNLVHQVTGENVPRKVPAGAQIDRSVFRRADGHAYPEERSPQLRLYTTSNLINGGPGHNQILDAAQAGKTRTEQEAYLKKLGLVFHDDTGQTAEKALPEKGVQPLTITQMAAAWNEKPDPPAAPPAPARNENFAPAPHPLPPSRPSR